MTNTKGRASRLVTASLLKSDEPDKGLEGSTPSSSAKYGK